MNRKSFFLIFLLFALLFTFATGAADRIEGISYTYPDEQTGSDNPGQDPDHTKLTDGKSAAVNRPLFGDSGREIKQSCFLI